MSHPIQISFTENKTMKAWDLAIFIGNFQSEAKAKEAAAKIKVVLENGFNDLELEHVQ